MKGLSIQKKITLFYSALLLLLALFTAVFLLFTADTQLQNISQASLEQAVKNASNEIFYNQAQMEIGPDFDFYPKGVTILLYGPNGTKLAGTAPFGFPAGTPLISDQCRVVEEGEDTFLVYDLLLSHPEASSIWIRGLSLMDDTIVFFQIMRRISLIVLPAVLLLAVFGGSFLTRKAFAPVEQMCRTAGEISVGNDLSRRIEIKGSKNELFRLAQAWNHMMGRLQNAFENERRFSTDVSHELKTPIAVILSYCEYALDRPRSEEEYRRAFLDIQKQAKRMSALSSQLLELSQNMNAEGGLQLEQVDLSLLCESVCEEMEEQAHKKGIRMETKLQPALVAWVDELQWMRLLINLLSNGVRYGKEGGRLSVSLWTEGQKIWLTVTDDGEGIPEEELPYVFERFHRGRNGEGKKEGLGLGLSYVRWIAEAHGGGVSVKSKPGESTVFTVWIPEKRGV